MADIIVPAPDPNGYWHFLYVTTDPLDGRWYGGRRSSKRHPLSNRYLGSGNWIRAHPTRERLQRRIVAFYATSAELCAAEAELITWNIVLDDPLCMNLRDGGEGMTVEGAQILAADPAWRESVAAACRRRSSNPIWKKAHTERMRRRHDDPEFRANLAAGIKKARSSLKWITNHAAAMRRNGDNEARNQKISAKARARFSDPAFKEKIVRAIRERSKGAEWIARNAAQRARIYADQVACAKRNEAVRRNASDPAWRAAQLAAARRRSEDPVWLANTAAANRRKAEDPAWRAALAEGLKKRAANYAAKRAAKAALTSAEASPEQVSA